MNITVTIKNVYGNELTYPVCETAKTFARLLGTKTIPDHALQHIKALGYTIRVASEVTEL
jgi:hypothetical protein